MYSIHQLSKSRQPMFSLEKHLVLFSLSGRDVAAFLQNQTINAFGSEMPQPHYTAICNAKGRILFSVLLWQQADDVYLAVDQSLAEQFEQYIRMRIFRMAVKVTRTTALSPVITETELDLVKHIRLVTDASEKSVESDQFWALFFRSELPWITQQTSEQFIPQHLSLDQHQLIDYQKGCYPGQEIIARLHFIGRNKKILALQYMPADTTAKNGEKVTINDNPVQLCSPVINFNGQLCAQIVKNRAEP